MPTSIAVSGNRQNDQDFFTDTKQLLAMLIRLNKAAKPIFSAKAPGLAVDMARMRWTEEGGAVLGEITDLVLREARRSGRRWNPSTKAWEAGK